MSLSFRKRQPIPELHIDEAARAVAAQHAESDAMPTDVELLSTVDQRATNPSQT
jgi:hypothetical protein